MSLKKALLAATVLSLPVAAQAQPITGLYVGAGAGGNYRMENRDERLSVAGSPAQLASIGANRDVKIRTNFGYVGVGSIGYGFGNGIRAEIEGNYRNNEIDRVNVFGRGSQFSGGTIHQYGVMANAIYDFNSFSAMSPIPGITPYVGVGAGYVWSDWRRVRGTASTGGANSASVLVDDRDGRFAYQALAGVAYNLGAVAPGLALTLEYRFMGTLEPKLNASSTVSIPGSSTTSGSQFRPDNYNHSVLLGLRYAFNAPRPAVIAAVAPAPVQQVARTYLVFFDWDRADLTERARQIIGEAAAGARTARSTRIEVSGHADRSGSPDYNQRLSQRRADAVAAELVRRGVARNEIGVQAFGESRPLVPTADNVREPQNRRVEIVLR